MHTQLPEWAFDAALYISEARKSKFRNRFGSQKLRGWHRNELYFKHSESIIGYLGDIAASALLGVDPVEMLEEMIDATDGLAHRDQFDIWFNGYHIDAKIENYGDCHELVIQGKQGEKDRYGCRLINEDQWNENRGFTDIYLFGCFDPPLAENRLLHSITRAFWVGYATSEQVELAKSAPYSPAGARLPRPAKLIPHSELHPIDELFRLPAGPRSPAEPKQYGDDQLDLLLRIAALKGELRAIASRKASETREGL